ncbi:TetR family transcriptional regulator [Paenibacillus yonginensis]|uniref:TetR family transcriptional regulator n=1 Tax=Paenibacillus yonginensis TaxID=1462996 RepID=A0A1B1N460_9BACL|nr:TetR/AcrR family transcriptional regulator [Paenibacillus yonginensis]ANS76213.1 TetR family transcriptional regulator [Paenibacillus yonginensis]
MARNKEFDEKTVLDKAMRLFWEQGYEKTSMNDLVEHMGIHRRSLYDTFSDKHTLFLKSMDRFDETINGTLSLEIQRYETAADALVFVLRFMVIGDEEMPPGCLLVNTAAELAVRDVEVDAKTLEGFRKTEDLIREIVIKGQRNGEFKASYHPEDLAEYIHSTLIGLRVMARTSVPKEKLEQIMALLIHSVQK